MSKPDKPKKGDQKDDRRFGDFVYRNGKMYHNYQVFDDGRINAHWFVGGFRLTDDEHRALQMMVEDFNNYMNKRYSALAEKLQKQWRDFIGELKLIDPAFDNERYAYGLHYETGMVTKTENKKPAAQEIKAP